MEAYPNHYESSITGYIHSLAMLTDFLSLIFSSLIFVANSMCHLTAHFGKISYLNGNFVGSKNSRKTMSFVAFTTKKVEYDFQQFNMRHNPKRKHCMSIKLCSFADSQLIGAWGLAENHR